MRLTTMSTSQQLTASLQNILNGDPWYGPKTYDIIDNISFETAYETPPGSVHNIAGIMLHMLGWTLETTARMQGQTAGEPKGGDWPNPGRPDEQKWQQKINSFKLANVTLIGIVTDFPEDKWHAPTNDKRNHELGTGVTYRALLEGLIQHHVYHSGQLALLNRIVG